MANLDQEIAIKAWGDQPLRLDLWPSFAHTVADARMAGCSYRGSADYIYFDTSQGRVVMSSVWLDYVRGHAIAGRRKLLAEGDGSVVLRRVERP